MTYRFDPELAAVIQMLPVPDFADLASFRALLAEFKKSMQFDTTGVDARDVCVPGPPGAPEVPVRVYRPAHPDQGTPTEPTAALLNLHGGGFVIGDVSIDEGVCLDLVRALGVVVVSVDYRLAPEHPFPAPLEDCYAALEWLAKNTADLGVDPTRVAVRGISAGAGLAAGLALLARDRGGPPLCFQFLGVPEIDDRLDTPSMRRFVDTPMWNRPNAVLSWNYYLGEGVPGTPDVSPYAAPARATDLAGLPPAYISVMEFDPLRDEGIAYAQALLAAEVPVELHLFPGTFHGSGIAAQAAVSRRENREATAVLAAAFGISSETAG
ncbi:alpha/beta hydrolase [Frankia sp. CNm7]|uniref:Alpha/beta hydrolase n=1 Tax=Frankia nepalensis TaxID=1836974 RepID=A0A937RGD7_9ACTN|nr:alpha/beta hydrolase [Frankia nepalensis]MBL7499313.1 alpha/beta hydrolase [Frankia nepalensis]MBL7512702.1 alpha/beta hydrolase [Frankia nepalensis]MBL7517704.1 alpha/beta hydrolase [Frankia nepalensis]MBL7629915.1 alpha/beta hydrolase [Frankia nepalensis]